MVETLPLFKFSQKRKIEIPFRLLTLKVARGWEVLAG